MTDVERSNSLTDLAHRIKAEGRIEQSRERCAYTVNA
jgi:hypothetical protein